MQGKIRTLQSSRLIGHPSHYGSSTSSDLSSGYGSSRLSELSSGYGSSRPSYLSSQFASTDLLHGTTLPVDSHTTQHGSIAEVTKMWAIKLFIIVTTIEQVWIKNFQFHTKISVCLHLSCTIIIVLLLNLITWRFKIFIHSHYGSVLLFMCVWNLHAIQG